MKVMVTGARGMLGQDICSILENIGAFVIDTDINNLDITDKDAVMNFVKTAHPDIIIHCAAYTNVDKAESDKENAYKINKEGTENVASAAGEIDALMVYISTDYVFDATSDKPLKPNDKVNPVNIYGDSKYKGEEAVRKYAKKHYITRTSWLYGHHGKNFVETMISLANKEELKVVNDQTGCPTWSVDLSRGILKLIGSQKPYGTYHICGSGKTTWYGFAKEIFNQMNLDVNLKPCTTDEMPRDAIRPKYSVMDNQGICPDWRESLKEYIKLRGNI